MNELLLSEILTMVRWGIDAIDAESKGEKTEEDILAEHEKMQARFKSAVDRWRSS